VRSFDVATFLAFGAAHMALAGSDVLLEFNYSEIYTPLDLGIGKCRLAVAEAKDLAQNEDPQRWSHLRVATKYPEITRRHFARRGVQAECIKLNGALELAPQLGLCRRIVDLVASGRTLKENGLVEVEHIADVTTRFAVNRSAFKTRSEQIRFWLERFQAAAGSDAQRLDVSAAGFDEDFAKLLADREAVTDDVSDVPPRHPRRRAQARRRGADRVYAAVRPSRPLRRAALFGRRDRCRGPRRAGRRPWPPSKPPRPGSRPSIAVSFLPISAIWTRPASALGMLWKPLDAVGLYVPGGRAAYPSSVLMNALPARVAGVSRLAMVVPTPDGVVNPLVLAAARRAGVDEVYRVGGAQAVGALAFGTASIAAVDKIVGPGNAYVATAKRMVFGRVGIDSIAGPSEILVVADGLNDPSWIAADLLSQAEHDPDSQSVLISDDAGFIDAVFAAVEFELASLPRAEIARAELARPRRGHPGQARWTEAAELVDAAGARASRARGGRAGARWLPWSVNAGAIFLGRYTPEAVGDYVAGPNHVLPTSSGGALLVGPFGARLPEAHDPGRLRRRTALADDRPGGGGAGTQAEGLPAHALIVSRSG
jgi:histidinol dehydrogenase